MNPIPLPYRVLVVLLMIGACIGFGYVQGVTRESDRRDAQLLEQKRADEKAFSAALDNGKRHASNAIEWRNEARIYYLKWKERLAHENDQQLIVNTQCIVAAPGRVSATYNVGRDLSLSATWVGLYNAAWLPESDHQGDTGGAAYALVEAGAVTRAATPREVLDNVGINAELCGADRKRLDELIDLLNEIGTGK